MEPLKNILDDQNLPNDVHDVHNVHPIDFDKAINPANESIDTARRIVDKALSVCKDNPGIFGSTEFAESLKVLYADPKLMFEYRVKLKQAKPSGVLLSDIDSIGSPPHEGGGQDSAATELIDLVINSGRLFFDSVADKAYVCITVDGIEHTLAIGSKPFLDWMSYKYYSTTKVGEAIGKSASENAIKQASFALAGIAKHDGDEERVFLRVAENNGGHYLFIGDDQKLVIEVLPTGWRLLKKSPVKFWQPGSMQSLPLPITGGDLSKLWEFVNIPKQDKLLVLAWLLEAIRAETPKPILALSGPQGSAKSSTHNKLRQLVDNNSVNLRAAPKSIEDIFISAGCNWLVSFENLSHISPAMQDALCTLATGGGFSARTLYTNNEETIIEVKRPVLINSIPSVISAQDLTDRAISIELPRIKYREESEINKAWELAKPSIFGGLLDLFVNTLAVMPSVKLVNPPRMADFTRLGEAMAQSLGHSARTFDALYKANRAESIGRALEASPIAVAVRELVEGYAGLSGVVYSGTMKELLFKLEKYKQDSSAWPKSPRGLGDVLRRQQPALASLEIEVEISKPGRNGVTVEIKKREHCEHREHGFKDIHAPETFSDQMELI